MIPLPLVPSSSHVPSSPSTTPRGSRSLVPDLLFEDEQESRLAEIRPWLEEPEGLPAEAPLHRLTVFLTYRCNLACVYCKTIARTEEELVERPQKARTMDLDGFTTLLNSFGTTPIRHLHFTGGEAALIRDLPEMIRRTRSHGVERLSITSNGTLPAEVYERMIESGIDEIRISIDADDPLLADELSLRPSAWWRTVHAIERLAELRRLGAPFFLIFNAVIEKRNRSRMLSMVRFLLGLKPDDLKLITEVDQRDTLGHFAGADTLLAGIQEVLDDQPPGSYPLLRRKLATVFAQDAIGLEDVDSVPAADWRCYIPLTERTVDDVYYYPCSVYLREGGEPLGRIDEPQEMQRAKTAAFVRDGNCLSDPICRRYCLHCTRSFNVRCNEART